MLIAPAGVLSLSELKREIAVENLRLPEPNAHLIQLSLDPNYAPRQSKAADQCCGVYSSLCEYMCEPSNPNIATALMLRPRSR